MGGGGRGRLDVRSGTVCATHTHKIATSSTGTATDKGTTSVAVTGQIDRSGQTDNSDNRKQVTSD